MSNSKFQITKLGHTNYPAWKTKMRALFILEDLWEVVEVAKPSTRDFVKRNGQALALIILNVEDYHLASLANLEIAAEAWSLLGKQFWTKSDARLAELRYALNHLQLGPKESVSEYVGRARTLHAELVSMGGSMSDAEVGIALVEGLPSAYNLEKATMLTFIDTMSIDWVMQRLLTLERRMEQRGERSSGTIVYSAVAGPVKFKGSKEAAGRGNSNKGCWLCGSEEHLKADCPKNPKNKAKNAASYSAGALVF